MLQVTYNTLLRNVESRKNICFSQGRVHQLVIQHQVIIFSNMPINATTLIEQAIFINTHNTHTHIFMQQQFINKVAMNLKDSKQRYILKSSEEGIGRKNDVI